MSANFVQVGNEFGYDTSPHMQFMVYVSLLFAIWYELHDQVVLSVCTRTVLQHVYV